MSQHYSDMQHNLQEHFFNLKKKKKKDLIAFEITFKKNSYQKLCSYLSSEVHHYKEQGLKKGKLILEHPDEWQSLHQELNGHHTAQFSVPGLLIAAGTQTLDDVGEQWKLTSLKVKTYFHE